MSAYVIERYEMFYFIFMNCGWPIFCIGALISGAILCALSSSNVHRGQIRYYGIIVISSLLLIGVIGSIFLPSPELVKAWLK